MTRLPERSAGALIALSIAMFSPSTYANCRELVGSTYPIVQCGRGSWFAPAPPGSGAIAVAWWQIGFGNHGSAHGGTAGGQVTGGTGYEAGAGFIGNDSGLLSGDPAGLDLVDATLYGGPAGALCFGSRASWALPGIDGCPDNARTGSGTFIATKDDDLLNPYFYASLYKNGSLPPDYIARYLGHTLLYQIDAPMAVLATEATGRSFALAFLATKSRGGDPFSFEPGSFDLGDVVNGEAHPISRLPSVIPWQPVPEPDHVIAPVDPSDPSAGRVVSMSWDAVRLVHDGSVRPSEDTTLITPGVGVVDQGVLIHHTVETAPVVDSAGACGTFTTTLRTDETTASLTLLTRTCVRLRTAFGRIPQPVAVTRTNAAQGRLGDLGYGVVSATTIVDGPLAVETVTLDAVEPDRGIVRVRFTTGSELTVSSIEVIGIDGKGGETRLASEPCRRCGTGLGAAYEVGVPRSSLRGTKEIVVVMRPSGARDGPRAVAVGPPARI